MTIMYIALHYFAKGSYQYIFCSLNGSDKVMNEILTISFDFLKVYPLDICNLDLYFQHFNDLNNEAV